MEAAAGEDKKLLIYSRVVGFMILEAHSEPGRAFIAREIKECLDKSENVNLLAAFYVDYIFAICKFNKLSYVAFIF